MSENELFFELLSISLGQRERFSETPDARQWKSLFDTAKKHTLIGICSKALDILEGEQRAPLEIYLQWLFLAEKIAETNKNYYDNERKLHKAILEKGFRCCFLKGQGNAAYYPNPELRQSGDIDVWVEGNRKKIIDIFSAGYPVRNIIYHHFEVKLLRDTKVEVHFTPSWMVNPFTNRKLQKYFACKADEQFSNYVEIMGFCIPKKDFACVHSFIHSFRHLFSAGVGLRHFTDCYFIVAALEQNERVSVMEELTSLGLRKYTAAVMYILQEVFGLKQEYLLCSPDSEGGKLILNDVMSSGNFGKYGLFSDKILGSKSFFVRGWFQVKHINKFISLNPKEVFWTPIFKIWRRLQ